MNRARSEEYTEAKRLERNRRACPTAVKVVDVLFDLSKKYPALEELAIRADGSFVQAGIEIDSDSYANILGEAARLMETATCEVCAERLPKYDEDGNWSVALDEESGLRVCGCCLDNLHSATS